METPIRWDHDKIKRALRDHVCRQKFLTSIEEKPLEADVVGKAVTNPSPDQAWEALVTNIKKVAAEHFQANLKGNNYERHKERDAMLQQIGECRRQMGLVVEEEPRPTGASRSLSLETYALENAGLSFDMASASSTINKLRAKLSVRARDM